MGLEFCWVAVSFRSERLVYEAPAPGSKAGGRFTLVLQREAIFRLNDSEIFDDPEHSISEPEFVFIHESRNHPVRMALLKLAHVSPGMDQVSTGHFVSLRLQCFINRKDDDASMKALVTGD